MESEEYTKAILLLIKMVRKHQSENSEMIKHSRYLFNQALYGYEQFAKRFVSIEAKSIYNKKGYKEELINRFGRDQKKFDPEGKLNGIFHLDHVFTNTMFRNALNRLSDKELTVENIENIE